MWEFLGRDLEDRNRKEGTCICALQARSQGGFEGVRTNPPGSLANLFLMRQQQYMVQSFNRAVARGSHIHVTCRSVCNRDQEF